MPKSATPVGATRDLAHWEGGDSARVAKSLITTRPTLNNGGLAARTLWDWREPLGCAPVPAGAHSSTVQQPSTGPLRHAVGTSDRPERPAQSGHTPYEWARTRRLSRPGSGASTPRTAGCHPSLMRYPWWRRLLPWLGRRPGRGESPKLGESKSCRGLCGTPPRPERGRKAFSVRLARRRVPRRQGALWSRVHPLSTARLLGSELS